MPQTIHRPQSSLRPQAAHMLTQETEPRMPNMQRGLKQAHEGAQKLAIQIR